jgi:hypothetical protein
MSRYKFITGCPACGNNKLIHFTHADCGGEEEIDENGDIHCLKCKRNLGFIMDLDYNCGNHCSKTVTDATTVFQALAIMTDSQRHIPADFARKISIKIMKRLS